MAAQEEADVMIELIRNHPAMKTSKQPWCVEAKLNTEGTCGRFFTGWLPLATIAEVKAQADVFGWRWLNRAYNREYEFVEYQLDSRA